MLLFGVTRLFWLTGRRQHSTVHHPDTRRLPLLFERIDPMRRSRGEKIAYHCRPLVYVTQ
jgi:hypothetical protein